MRVGMTMAEPAAEPMVLDVNRLSPRDRLRFGAFRLFSRLLDTAPDALFFASLKDAGLVEELVSLATQTASPAAGPLKTLAQWLENADAHACEEARRDFLQIFVSTRHLPAPPWESVYRSADRMVNQESAREVLLAYAEARLGFEGMKAVPADHISLELGFAAALIAESAQSGEAEPRLRAFEAGHLSAWVPSFCADLAKAATSPVYRSLASALPLLLSPALVG